MSSIEEATEIDKVLTRECLVDNKYLSDVIFKLADGEEMMAHKLFLITSSSFFHKLFSEHKEDVITLNVEWISKPSMLEVCRFIYTYNINLSVLNMMEIWTVALEFEMKILLKKAFDFICKNLNEKTVFQILTKNIKHKDFRLNMKCLEFIKNNTEMCVENREKLRLDLQATIQSLVQNLAKENEKVEDELNLLARNIGQCHIQTIVNQQLSDVQKELPKVMKNLMINGTRMYCNQKKLRKMCSSRKYTLQTLSLTKNLKLSKLNFDLIEEFY